MVGRIQVNDLAPPDAIRPSQASPDYYSRPALPPINNDLERLEQSLGMLSTGLSAYAEKHKEDLTKAQLAEWERWKQSRSSTEALDLVKAGKAPLPTDKVAYAAFSKDYGGMEAEALGRELDAGTPDGFGTQKFNPDAYIVEKAKPYMDRLASNDMATLSFGNHLDTLKRAFRNKHEKALGANTTALMEDSAARHFRLTLDRAVLEGASPAAAMEALRSVYTSLGPRPNGAYGIAFKDMDKLLLRALDEKAQDPAHARLVQQLLNEPRKSLDGTGGIGALTDIARNREAALSIFATASKTLAVQEKGRVKQLYTQDAATRFEKGDGSTAVIKDVAIPSKELPGKTFKMTGNDIKEEGFAEAIRRTRAANGGKPDIGKEITMAAREGVAHPEFIPMLKTGYGGIATANIGTPGNPDPKQVEEIQRLAELYDAIEKVNPQYVKEQLGDANAVRFYESFSIRTRFMGQTPEQAALHMVTAARKEPLPANILAERQGDIDSKIAGMDLSYGVNGWQWTKSYFGSNEGEYTQDLKMMVREIALEHIRDTGIDPKGAIDYAANMVERRALNINGRAIVDATLFPSFETSGDEEAIYKLLKGYYKANKQALRNVGVTDKNQLSLLPVGNGTFFISTVDGTPLTVGPYTLTAKQIHAKRAELEGISEAELRKRMEERLKPGPRNSDDEEDGHVWWKD